MLMLWCEPCGYGWDQAAGRECWECGEVGGPVDLAQACRKATGLAAEGAVYARAHPGWTP